MMFECTDQTAEGLPRSRQISRLQGLTDGGKILLSLADLERVAVGKWATLAQALNVGKLLLRGGEVTGLKRLAELLKIGTSLAEIRLQILLNGTCGNGGSGHRTLLRTRMLAIQKPHRWALREL